MGLRMEQRFAGGENTSWHGNAYIMANAGLLGKVCDVSVGRDVQSKTDHCQSRVYQNHNAMRQLGLGAEDIVST